MTHYIFADYSTHFFHGGRDATRTRTRFLLDGLAIHSDTNYGTPPRYRSLPGCQDWFAWSPYPQTRAAIVEHATGIEPATLCLEGRCSGQLNYACIIVVLIFFFMQNYMVTTVRTVTHTVITVDLYIHVANRTVSKLKFHAIHPNTWLCSSKKFRNLPSSSLCSQ